VTRGEGGGASDSEGPGHGIVWMPRKVRRRDATPDLLSKHPNATVATYV